MSLPTSGSSKYAGSPRIPGTQRKLDSAGFTARYVSGRCAGRCVPSLLLWACLLLSFCSFTPSLDLFGQDASVRSEVISQIRLQGLDRLGTAQVMARMKVRVGDRWDPAALDEEYRRLWTSGDFVTIDAPLVDHTEKGVIITIMLRERRRIQDVQFEGAENLSVRTALKEIRSRKDELHDPLLVREDLDTVIDLLLKLGHPFARVDTRTEETDEGLRIIFELDEGPQVRIQRVDLQGTGSIPIADIFKVMQLRTRIYFGLGRSGKFDPRLLEQDLDQIRTLYVAKGFFDAEVSLGQLDFQNGLEDLRILILVDEGPRYRVGEIEFQITGPGDLSQQQLLAALKLTAGSDWDGEIVQSDTEVLRTLFSDLGFLDAAVSPSLTYPLEGQEVLLIYRITVGSKVTASEIGFRGNGTTRDDVIRRQLVVYPGEELHNDAIQDSLSNLHRLQYFDQVRPQFEGGTESDQRPVVFELSEMSTGRALFGVGYSSGRGAVGNLAIEKRNFDISDFPESLSDLPGSFTGGGQRLVLEAQPGTEYSRYRLLFSEPYLGGSQNSLNVSAFRSVLLRREYIEDRNSVGLTFGRLFNREERIRGSLGLRHDLISVNDVSASAPLVVKDSAGKTRYTALDLDLEWNQRVYRPVIGSVDGWYVEGGYSHIGGPLGGDLEVAKLDFSTGLFKTTFQDGEDYRHVFAARTSFNWAEPLGADDQVPVFERYYLGGPRSLRGFDYRGVGPREDDQEIGGTVRHRGSIEYTWPLIENTLRGIVFTDFGNLSDGTSAFSFDDYRVGVGGGVVINVPIFGQPLPISITWTEAVKKQEGDRIQEFSFDLGWFLN